MKLYYSPGTCALAPHIILQEIRANYLLAQGYLKGKKTEGGEDYTKINPAGVVPALELDNGELLTENAVILQYLAAHYQERNLIPPSGTFERYRALEILNFITTELHKAFSVIFSAEQMMNTNQQADLLKSSYLRKADQKLALISLKLGLNNFLLGEFFSIADAYLFVILTWAKKFNMNLSLYPNLVDYYQRLLSRPSVASALKEENMGEHSKGEVAPGPLKSPLP